MHFTITITIPAVAYDVWLPVLPIFTFLLSLVLLLPAITSHRAIRLACLFAAVSCLNLYPLGSYYIHSKPMMMIKKASIRRGKT